VESQTPVGNQALVPLSIKALCLFLTRATHAQAAQLLHLPCNYGLAAMGMVVFVAIAVGAAVVSGRAGQQPVEEEDIY